MAAAAEATPTQQRREDDSRDIDSSLPARVVIGPDAYGARKEIEYRFDEEAGNMVKVVTIVTPVRKLARPRASTSRVAPATKGILPERPHASGIKAQEPTVSDVPLVKSIDGSDVVVACRICCTEGDHWTERCPSRVLSAVGTSRAANRSARPNGTLRRAKRDDDVKTIMRDDRCIRVTNLSKRANESHLTNLFCLFGYVDGVYIPVDEESGSSSGVGYVKFAKRSEAEAAISFMNGHTYDNLVLQIGWAAPRVK